MNDSERAHWKYQQGLPEKEVRLLQVQALSRDLEYCSRQNKGPVLSDKELREIARQNAEQLRTDLT